MAIEARYLHTLVVKRAIATGATDDYGGAITAPTTVATVPGLVQLRKAYEVAVLSQAGPVVGTYVGYMAPLASLGTDCWIELSTPASMAGRYDVVDIDSAGGLDHHLELSLRKVS